MRPAGCVLPRLHREKNKKEVTSHSEVRGNGPGSLRADPVDSLARVSTYANTHLCVPRLSVYMRFTRGGRSDEALALVSLRERLIYEAPSTVPLHNVPIRSGRHCGSVHHLAPATSTPGGVEIGRAKGGWLGGGAGSVHYLGISYRSPLKLRPAASVYSRADKEKQRRD